MKTRKFNLVLLLITGSSWLFLGLIVGALGYCPLTDWHFSVLNKLGISDLPSSYVKYLADRLTGLDLSPSLVDNVTLYSFLAAFGLSTYVNYMDFIAGRKKNNRKGR